MFKLKLNVGWLDNFYSCAFFHANLENFLWSILGKSIISILIKMLRHPTIELVTSSISTLVTVIEKYPNCIESFELPILTFLNESLSPTQSNVELKRGSVLLFAYTLPVLQNEGYLNDSRLNFLVSQLKRIAASTDEDSLLKENCISLLSVLH